MTDLLSNLPRIKVEEIPIYNYENDTLSGFLNKKASKQSTFSRGKWQKRYFVIQHDIDQFENYNLSYYYSVTDRVPRQTFELKKAAVYLSGGLSFTLDFEDGTTLVLSADSQDNMNKWIDSLQRVISVATIRDKLIHEKKASVSNSQSGYNKPDAINEDRGHQNKEIFMNEPVQTSNVNPFQSRQRKLPTIRIYTDLNSMPPSSPQRRQFVELFIQDIAKCLKINPKILEVVSIKPAPHKENMALVEFDVNLYLDAANQFVDINDDYLENQDEIDDDKLEKHEFEMDKRRYKILWTINDYLKNPSSPLYNGIITRHLDPTFSKYLIDDDDNTDNVELTSSDSRVQSILDRYKDTVLPVKFLDITHFTIYLSFEGIIRPFAIPNPIALPRKHCAIYPFEIKQVLGLMGTMQELWIEPVALVPRDMPKSLSQPIMFEASARLNHNVIIHTSKLKADLTYDVQCEDYRGQVVRNLTDEEIESIKSIFDEYDKNGDGNISKLEMEELIRARTQERVDMIEDMYNDLVENEDVSDDEICHAQESRRQYLQHVEESKAKMINMFDAADINGDGMITFTEFMLMEAWWLRCTLNPEKAHLF